MPVKVCHVTTVHDAFDDRIFYKECKALAQAGYEVYLIATCQDRQDVDDVHIVPLPDSSGRLNRFIVKDFKALVQALNLKAAVYHLHDPELIPMGLILKLLGKKVIYDSHEDVPANILDKEWIGNVAVRRLVSHIVGAFEKAVARFFDAVISVTPEIVGKFKVKKAVLIRNLPVMGMIEEAQLADVDKDRPIAIYAGGLTRIRGIKELVDAAGLLEGRINIWLLGKWESDEYENECMAREGSRYVKYLGFKPLEEVYGYMKRADIGVTVLYPAENYIGSLPVKSFEYMACGLPMVMSDFEYWQKMFKGCAVFVNPKDPENIKKGIAYLMDNTEAAKAMAKKGRELMQGEYSWEAESKKLIALYDEEV